jgi:4-hydroxy-tetrahydrodipicolinate synthase
MVEANFGVESLRKTMQQVRYAEEVGLDVLRIIQPYYVKPSQDGYREYFERIADETTLPIHLYPAYLTDRHIEPDVIVELAKRENIVGMKVHHQSMPELAHIDSLTEGENFQIIPGANSRWYHMYRAGMCNATHGVEPLITPEWTSTRAQALKREDWETAREITVTLNEL